MYDYEDSRIRYFILGISAAILIISVLLGLMYIKIWKEPIKMIEPLKKFYTFPIDIN